MIDNLKEGDKFTWTGKLYALVMVWFPKNPCACSCEFKVPEIVDVNNECTLMAKPIINDKLHGRALPLSFFKNQQITKIEE